MNKKLMTLAVAGAFAAPAAVFAQASNVQIFGTIYMEYAYAKQGSLGASPTVASPAAAYGVGGVGELVNVDLLQSPGSEIGIKGEEALGGGTSVWFQCTSTADIRGSSTAGFCSRNSAIGVKGAFGNAYAGSWDMPMKRTAGAARITSDTGIWGVGRMLYGDSSTFNGAGTTMGQQTAFSRRQNNSIFYDTPNFSGFQGFFGISTTVPSLTTTPGATPGSLNLTNNSSGAKPRVWSVAGTYNNGPLYVTLAYENHKNFSASNGAILTGTAAQILAQQTALGISPYNGTDTAWHAGVGYQFGPVKVGLLYVHRTYDMSANGVTDTTVKAWNLAGQWAIVGPHSLRGGYTSTQDTSGNANMGGLAIGGAGGGFVANGGAGGTGANMWQVQYVYNASKRTEFTAGYVSLNNDDNARYTLGGLQQSAVSRGTSQNAFAVSIKNTF